jgi:ADP-ribose pyrophosphatase YjhB (NUDIX family)
LLLKRKYPSQPIVGVGVVIVDGGKVVLVKRGNEPALGKWSFPGGAVELGEAIREAVVREAKEECGLEVKLVDDTPLDINDILKFDENGLLRYHYVLLEFLAKLEKGALKHTSDVTAARWVPLEQVEKYDLTESVRSFFKKHVKELKKI